MKNRITTYSLIVVICLVLGQSPVAKAATDLILNGSFENGPTPNPSSYYSHEMGRSYRQSPIARPVPATDWSSTGFYEWMAGPDSYGSDGTACVAAMDNAGTTLLYQDGISLNSGASYTFSIDIWQSSNRVPGPSLDVRLTTGDASDFAAPENALTLVTGETTLYDGAVETVSVDFTPSVTDASYAIQIQGTLVWANYMFLDNVQLLVTSEVWDGGGGR